MTREELARELRALPPEEAAALLRELLEREVPSTLPMEAWLRHVDRLLNDHRAAWQRLARR